MYKSNSLNAKLAILKDLYKQMGPSFLYLTVKRICQLYYYKIFKNRTFKLNNQTYKYYYAIYNTTFLKERAVEIPIIMKYVKEYEGKRILEIGNVLSHYENFVHEIVDKYEKAEEVNNTDIIEYKPEQKYDLVVSISTFEHIGWDETPKVDDKVLVALNRLKSFMNPGGKAVLTLPLGHNHYFEKILKDKLFNFNESYFLKRISKDNQWVQIEYKDIGDVQYDYPYQNANVLFIGVINN